MKSLKLLTLRRVVFWEPSTSPHKSDFISAFASAASNIEVICCANSGLSLDRQEQGWSIKSSNVFRTIVKPSKADTEQLVSDQIESTLHIFSGIRWVPNIVLGLKAVKLRGAKFAIMSEPRVREGWKGALRVLQSWVTEGWLRHNAEFILAQGRNGPPWFRTVGYPADRIFPFAYFVDIPKRLSLTAQKADVAVLPIQIGYVGRLVKTKGIFDLVVAVAELGSSAQLIIVGSGPDKQALKTACVGLRLDPVFLGVLPIQEVGDFMRKLDVLVLPSISKDGWGVVVSEALMCGTAVIGTPCVGASVMLDDPLFGKCVPPKSPRSIADAVRELEATSAFNGAVRTKREAVARSRLSAENGARHLLEIIRWRLENRQRPNPFYESKK